MNSASPNPGGARAFVLAIVKQCWRAFAGGSVWQWAEKKVFLSRKQSRRLPGWYSSAPTPYARVVMDFINDPDWDELIIEKSSQSGITEAILNMIRYCVAEKPMPIIYAIDSQQEVKRIAKIRLEPSIRDFLPEGMNAVLKEADMQTLMYDLPHMVIYFSGGGSSGALANKSAGLGVVDEADEHPPPAEGEFDNVEKMRERVKLGGKLIALGRPTTDKGLTHREYVTGTQEKFLVPCPHCGFRQELVHEGLDFSGCKDLVEEWDLERVLKETTYKCANVECCGGRVIREEHRAAMCLLGEWTPTPEADREVISGTSSGKKATPRKRSIHISDFYSPFATLGELAVEYLTALQSGDLTKQQAYWNSRRALPWKQERAEVTDNEILANRGPYKRGECPFPLTDVALIGVCTDKQGDVKKTGKFAFKMNGEIALIDYATHLADREVLEWSAQVPVLRFGNEPAPEMVRPCAKIGVYDEGFLAKIEVRDFVQSTGGFFHAIKGRGGIQVKATVAESITPHNGEEMIVYHYDDDNFKKELYISRIKAWALYQKKKLAVEPKAPRLWLPVDIDPDFVAECIAEKLVETKQPRGFSKWEWIKEKNKANDWGDVLKEALILWYIAKPLILAAQAAAAEAEFEMGGREA